MLLFRAVSEASQVLRSCPTYDHLLPPLGRPRLALTRPEFHLQHQGGKIKQKTFSTNISGMMGGDWPSTSRVKHPSTGLPAVAHTKKSLSSGPLGNPSLGQHLPCMVLLDQPVTLWPGDSGLLVKVYAWASAVGKVGGWKHTARSGSR